MKPRIPQPTKVSDASQGKRVLIIAAGSRGDVQPLVALGAACNKAGLDAFALTVGHHTGFFEDFNVRVEDCGKIEGLTSAAPTGAGPQLKRSGSSVAAGGMVLRKAASSEEEALSQDMTPAAIQGMCDYAADFGPDLIIGSLPCIAICYALGDQLDVPVMECSLWPMAPTARQRSPCGERAEAPGCFHYAMWLQFHKQVLGSHQEMQLQALKDALNTPETPCGWSNLRVYLMDIMNPIAPGLLTVSPAAVVLPDDAPAQMREASQCGYLVMSRQEQLTKADNVFGCRAVLRAFLEECEEPPLYFGWGPMVLGSPQAMARVAVGSARACERNVVVLCGGANLGPGLLQEERDKDLLNWVETGKVLFVRSAPHEWLFQHCAVIVHHGGVGTTACSLRSGIPTIVKPCCLEQVSQAQLVSKLGAGIGLDDSPDVSVESMAKMIKQCMSDAAMLAKCKEVSETLQGEDGLKKAVEHIDQFLTKEVGTGKWKKAYDRRQKERQDLLRGGSCSCFGWFGKILGLSARNQFAPR